MAWDNHLLDALDPPEIEALTPFIEPVELRSGQLLAEVGRTQTFAYLPRTSIISVVTVMRDGRLVESRTIGRESGVGLLHALGSRYSFERLTVQVAGKAYRISLDALADKAARHRKLGRCIVSHAQMTMVQATQSTACNALHSTEQRFCRRLLLTHDRLGEPDIVPLTQDHLAIMLGVQRTTVTAIARVVQAKGHISYARGAIRVLDRQGLRHCACECYEAIEEIAKQIRADASRW